MLAIQNLLKNVYCGIKNISKKSYRNCAVLVSGCSVFAMVSLNTNGFGGAGKNRSVVECGSVKAMEEDIKPEGESQESLNDGKGFAFSCKQAIETEQSKIKESEKARIKKKEVVAVCASIEPTHNEMQRPPLNPYGDIPISDEDYEALLRIVQAEAGGEDEQGRILVAEVILNRVLAKEFASTVYEVIFERSGGSPQFAPTADGRYYSVEVTEGTVEAVEKAIHEEDLSQGALFFSARRKANPYDMEWFDRNLTWLFQYGGHEFYTLP
ncbi:MAG: cell wall hydrolase [Lachnospiraceae bacterium]|nr:cell wall hydrolase [Lachnospiraceae bacterium]